MGNKKHLIRFLLGLGLLVLLVHHLNWLELEGLFTLISLQYLFPLLVLQLLTMMVATAIWCLLFTGLKIKCKFSKILQIHLAGVFADNITPGAKFGGEGVRLYWFRKHTQASYGKLTVLLIAHKLITILPLMIFCLPGIKWLVTTPNSQFTLAIKLALGLSTGIIFLTIVFFILAGKAKGNRQKPASLKGKTSTRFARGLAKLQEFKWQMNLALLSMRTDSFKRKLPLTLGLALLLWLLYLVKILLLAKAVQLPIEFLPLAGASFIAYLVGMLPITPGGLGTFEIALTSLLVILGGRADKIGVLLLLYRLITYVFPTLCGLIAFLTLVNKKAAGEQTDGKYCFRKGGVLNGGSDG